MKRIELPDFSPSLEAIRRAQQNLVARLGELPKDRMSYFAARPEDFAGLEPVMYGGEPRPREIFPVTLPDVPVAEPGEVLNPCTRIYYAFWRVGEEMQPVLVRHTIGSEVNYMMPVS